MKTYQWVIAAGVVPSVGIAAYFLLTSPDGRWELPLNPDVVGDVSSWVMVSVTAVTAWVFWQTLESQRKVQDSQEETLNTYKDMLAAQLDMLQLAQADRAFRMMPTFRSIVTPVSASIGTALGRLGDESKRRPIFLLFKIQCRNAPSRNVRINFNLVFRGETVKSDTTVKGDIDADRDFNLDFGRHLLPYVPFNEYNPLEARIGINYTDIDGNEYSQYIKFIPINNEWVGNPSAISTLD